MTAWLCLSNSESRITGFRVNGSLRFLSNGVVKISKVDHESGKRQTKRNAALVRKQRQGDSCHVNLLTLSKLLYDVELWSQAQLL